jgi:DNA-binding transcriptional ArsR family regulator
MDNLLFGKSKARAAILGLFFSAPKKEYYLRELERILGISVANIRRDITRLEEAGIFRSRKVGNLRYFSLNSSHPLFREYRSIVLKSIGLAGALTHTFRKLDTVDVAFVYGSAAERAGQTDDIADLFVVGTVSSKKLNKQLSKVQSKTGREIVAFLLNPAEFSRRFAMRDPIIHSLMKRKKDFVKGNEEELNRIAATAP